MRGFPILLGFSAIVFVPLGGALADDGRSPFDRFAARSGRRSKSRPSSTSSSSMSACPAWVRPLPPERGKCFPSVGLVFATGDNDLPDANRFSGSVLLTKPFDSAALDRAVKTALQQRL